MCTTFSGFTEVRDRARLLLKNFKLKIREEEKASGIEVPELSELDLALEEIVNKEKDAQVELDLEESAKKMNYKTKQMLKKCAFKPWKNLERAKSAKKLLG